MKKLLVFMLCLLFLTACFTSRKTSENTTKANNSVSTEADGSSYEKAILINENTEQKGVDAEYQWLRKNYPGYRVKMQSLNENKNIPYDILDIKTADGKSKKIYFDISKFFGKY
jgi:outer membrane biogenesis lipoprotein LolB